MTMNMLANHRFTIAIRNCKAVCSAKSTTRIDQGIIDNGLAVPACKQKNIMNAECECEAPCSHRSKVPLLVGSPSPS
jgi:hypothetical protein